MEGNGISTADSLSISSFVMIVAQLFKWGFGDRLKRGGQFGVVIGLALGGVILWAYSLPTFPDRTWIWGLAQAVASIALQAAGLYGFVNMQVMPAVRDIVNPVGEPLTGEVVTTELSPQQKGALTRLRNRNKAKAESKQVVPSGFIVPGSAGAVV